MGVEKLYTTPLSLLFRDNISCKLLDSVGSKSFGLFFGFGLYVLVIDYTLLVFPPDGCFGFGFFSYPMVFCTIRLIVYSRTFCARHFVTTMHKDVLVYVVRGVGIFYHYSFIPVYKDICMNGPIKNGSYNS